MFHFSSKHSSVFGNRGAVDDRKVKPAAPKPAAQAMSPEMAARLSMMGDRARAAEEEAGRAVPVAEFEANLNSWDATDPEVRQDMVQVQAWAWADDVASHLRQPAVPAPPTPPPPYPSGSETELEDEEEDPEPPRQRRRVGANVVHLPHSEGWRLPSRRQRSPPPPPPPIV